MKKEKYPYLPPYNKDLSPVDNLQKSMLIAKEVLDESVNPPWKEVKELFEKTRSIIGFCSPRTFLQIFDVSTTSAVMSYGLDLLGYEVDYRMTEKDAINFTHENQRALFAYQTSMVYRVFLEEPELVRDTGTVYSMTRSLRARDGIYWVVNQATIPIQYDENGRMVRYLSSYRILGKYRGEPFETAIYTSPNYPKAQEELRKRLAWIKLNMLSGLGFTRRQREVIEYAGEGFSKADILETMGIGETGLKKHREKILSMGRILFPKNDFKEALDVVNYLKKQGII